MKTKEEIYQLGLDSCDTWGEHCAFVEGYTQCQEDNKDKKYTYEDMRRAFFNGNVMRDIDEFNCFLTTI
jgi:hypothetical protein